MRKWLSGQHTALTECVVLHCRAAGVDAGGCQMQVPYACSNIMDRAALKHHSIHPLLTDQHRFSWLA
jgi:hypothetical protein